MNKIRFILPVLVFIAITACNNSEKTVENEDPKTALADSLQKVVLDEHDIAMPKSMKIPAIQKEIQSLIDSISKLPAKAQTATAPYKSKLEDLNKELSDAYSSMDKWMTEFKLDSTFSNAEEKIKYMTEEKMKVGEVKEAVLNSIQKADSVLQKKF